MKLFLFYIPCTITKGQRHEYRNGPRFLGIDLFVLKKLGWVGECWDHW